MEIRTYGPPRPFSVEAPKRRGFGWWVHRQVGRVHYQHGPYASRVGAEAVMRDLRTGRAPQTAEVEA